MSHTESQQQVPPTRSAAPTPHAGLLMLHGRHMRPEVLPNFVQALSLPVFCDAPAGPLRHEDGTRSWWPVDMVQREAELARGAIDLVDRYPLGREAARAVLAESLGALSERVPAKPLLLAGFSQGGMLALDYLLHSGDARVHGLGLFSTSRIAIDEWRPRLRRLEGLPILLAHGRRDEHLSFAAGEALRELLQGAGAQVTWLPFDGGHDLPLVVWRGLRRFVELFKPH